MKTLVLGASEKRERYANRAVRMLVSHGYEVIAIGKKAGKIDTVTIQVAFPQEAAVDTVSVYLNPDNQTEYFDKIVKLSPRRVIFNPGSENKAFENHLNKHQIATERACTLVLLSTNQF
ncbi:MAG: CoA-binding protein [Bacteroidetes bacterium]|nr:CoA-binding protein [Bacteroidota bacterium]